MSVEDKEICSYIFFISLPQIAAINERDRRIAIVALFQQGDQPSTVLQKLGLTMNQRKTVYNRYQKFLKTEFIESKKKRTSRASKTKKNAIQLIREKIRRNPARSQRKLARDHDLSQTTTAHCIIKDDLQISAFKCRKNKLYVADGPQERLRQAKLLKARHARFDPKNLIFSDEKIFTSKKKLNSKNIRKGY